MLTKKEISPNEHLGDPDKTNDVYVDHYDAMTSVHTEDLPMYQHVASVTIPPFLEVGCGTGRVLLYLLTKKPNTFQDHYVTGVDISEAMLTVSSRETGTFIQDGSLQLVLHDFSVGKLSRQQFHAAFVTFFTFNYIAGDQQLNFLANIEKSLFPDGILILDCFYPYNMDHPEIAGKWISNKPLIIDNRQIGFRQRMQMVTATTEKTEWMFLEPDGKTSITSRSKTYILPQKTKELIEAAGFTDVEHLHDYGMPGDKDFTEHPGDFNFVLMAKKQ